MNMIPFDDKAQQVKLAAVARLDLQTKECQQQYVESAMVTYLLSDAPTERGYFNALEVWVQCWRTLELLEQLYRPQTSSVRNIPAERCSVAQADMAALNGHFGYTPLASGQELPLGAAFPFWRQNSVDWYGLVYAMRMLTQGFQPIGQHLSAHFSQSFCAGHLSFFQSTQSNTRLSSADWKNWNKWLNACLTTDADSQAATITANEIFDWLNRCLKCFESPAVSDSES